MSVFSHHISQPKKVKTDSKNDFQNDFKLYLSLIVICVLRRTEDWTEKCSSTPSSYLDAVLNKYFQYLMKYPMTNE